MSGEAPAPPPFVPLSQSGSLIRSRSAEDQSIRAYSLLVYSFIFVFVLRLPWPCAFSFNISRSASVSRASSALVRLLHRFASSSYFYIFVEAPSMASVSGAYLPRPDGRAFDKAFSERKRPPERDPVLLRIPQTPNPKYNTGSSLIIHRFVIIWECMLLCCAMPTVVALAESVSQVQRLKEKIYAEYASVQVLGSTRTSTVEKVKCVNKLDSNVRSPCGCSPSDAPCADGSLCQYGQFFALKEIKPRSLTSEQERAAVQREFTAGRTLDCVHLVKYYRRWEAKAVRLSLSPSLQLDVSGSLYF